MPLIGGAASVNRIGTMGRRRVGRSTSAIAAITATILAVAAVAHADGGRFYGDTKCGLPPCHGAALPSTQATQKGWQPWKSARTQWRTSSIDHHSRAYQTLTTEAGRAIAGYMGIDATKSDKCLVCHAPDAAAMPGGNYRQSDGVTCEHCHGSAEQWVEAHSQSSWEQKRGEYFSRGFVDLRNYEVRARKCASCHVEIDHEIVAGGHPPLQFEMVAYAQIMKHWDDQRRVGGPDAFSPDPTLWAVGQITGLRRALAMTAERAGSANYAGLGKFPHFQSGNCYQCHHKLVEDALRQARGHYAMVEAIFGVAFPGERDALTSRWEGVVAAGGGSAEQTQSRAAALAEWLASYAGGMQRQRLDRAATKAILKRITSSGDALKRIERFSYNRPPTGNTVRVGSTSAPWWWTTGAPEQTFLAISSLCEPAYGAKSCGNGAIAGDLRRLLGAVDRFDYKPDQFSQALDAINGKLH